MGKSATDSYFLEAGERHSYIIEDWTLDKYLMGECAEGVSYMIR